MTGIACIHCFFTLCISFLRLFNKIPPIHNLFLLYHIYHVKYCWNTNRYKKRATLFHATLIILTF